MPITSKYPTSFMKYLGPCLNCLKTFTAAILPLYLTFLTWAYDPAPKYASYIISRFFRFHYQFIL